MKLIIHMPMNLLKDESLIMKRRIQKKILQKRQQLLETIVSILDDIDPVGIIFLAGVAGFRAKKEYLPEAEAIVVCLEKKMRLPDLEAKIKRIFEYYFYHPDIRSEYYVVAARRILNAWYVYQGMQIIDFPDDIELPKHPSPIIIEMD
ncbi:MAG: hypothetical protein JJV89_02175 [Desulfosarcina sp.]|nr:hypothetical protein [Desulfobacterales bacterium]